MTAVGINLVGAVYVSSVLLTYTGFMAPNGSTKVVNIKDSFLLPIIILFLSNITFYLVPLETANGLPVCMRHSGVSLYE